MSAPLSAEPAAEHLSTTELVVLVADDGTLLGTADKAVIHDNNTPLHLAFSCHVFDTSGRVLLTRRALSKRTFAGVWTNSFCGHPAPDETFSDAIHRRATRELGLTLSELQPVLPSFRYRAVDASGIVENEICPVFQAVVDGDPTPTPDEVAEWRWVQPADLRTAVEATPFAFSPWLVLQLAEWRAFGR